MVAVLVSALYGGFSAGLAAGGLTIVLVTYAILEPLDSIQWPSLGDAYYVAMFAIVATTVSLLASRHRRAEATLQATLASIGDGVIVTDADGRVTFLNAIAEQLTGWTSAAADGRLITEVFRTVDEAARQPLPNPVAHVLADPRAPRAVVDSLLVARDGIDRPIAASAASVHDPHGDRIGGVVVFRDVAQQRSTERRLRDQAAERERLLEREHAARQEAERANRVKDEFLATLSHELRTPLNAVLGWAHMLSTREFDREDRDKALAAIRRNALAQARLVDDLLDLSHIMTGRLAIETKPVELSEVVQGSADTVMPAVLAKHQDLQLELARSAMVMGDADRLRQIAWNLLSNAAKFTPEHGTIRARVAQSDGAVEFAVSDTGEGIDPSFLPFVFEPFRQGDASSTRPHAGLGLGLALVRQLVEAHGGTVAASSEGRGRGATITVRLPASPPADRGNH